MKARGFALLLLLYVALDFSNPMMPGAVSFDPEDCVEAVGAARIVAPAAAVTMVATPSRVAPVRIAGPASAPRPARPRERLVRARRIPASSSAPERSEDH